MDLAHILHMNGGDVEEASYAKYSLIQVCVFYLLLNGMCIFYFF